MHAVERPYAGSSNSSDSAPIFAPVEFVLIGMCTAAQIEFVPALAVLVMMHACVLGIERAVVVAAVEEYVVAAVVAAVPIEFVPALAVLVMMHACALGIERAVVEESAFAAVVAAVEECVVAVD